MTRTILITGGAGNIGRKLDAHCRGLGWATRRLDTATKGDPAVEIADLATWDDAWVARFAGVDTVIHLAGDPSPGASWSSVERLNVDLLLNVMEAAAIHKVRRLVFASSNWTMAGHRFDADPLTTDREPRPINPYGVSKWVGERAGRYFADRRGVSVICFRIGYNQHTPGNQPGTHMGWGRWGQEMWLSDRDLCHGFERAILAGDDVRFAVLNLMSANPGMRWDIETTRRVIGYAPADGAAAVTTPELDRQAETAAGARRLVDETERFILDQRW